jgi:hypothetical protein
MKKSAHSSERITPWVVSIYLSTMLIPSIANGASSPGDIALSAHDVDKLLVVDCLLPGQVRRLGTKLTYLTPRRPVKIAAGDCAIRGGEYVAYDRSDLNTALAVWLGPAKEGDKEAQTYVGEIYERGIGGSKPDYVAAAQWYKKASDQGFGRALINLGFLYEKGFGVEKNQAVALNLYRQASGLSGIIGLDEGASAPPARDDEIKALRQELEQTRQELEKARKDLKRNQSEKQSEIESLQRQKREAVQTGNREAVEKLEAQLLAREVELGQHRRDVARLEETLETYRARLDGATNESASLRRQLDEVRGQLIGSEKELETRRSKATEDQRQFEAIKAELERQKQLAASAADKAQVKKLEAQLKEREEILARQSSEIFRIEQEAGRYKAQLARLETSASAAPSKPLAPLVAFAPPSIQMIDPPLVTLRGPTSVKVRGGVTARELIGKVSTPAGLLSFTINDRKENIDPNGLFKTEIPISGMATPVTLIAVDNQGKRAALEFSLVPESYGAAARPATTKLAVPQLNFGAFHALVIGNQQYQHLPGLDTAVADAKAVSELLKAKYGFKVATLFNATRYQILSELNKLRAALTEKDNLLIYYAGHGELDKANLRGHWLPVDAEPNSDANWISSVAITDILNAMSVKHALVVADSCYSGAMTRSSIGQVESGVSEEAREKWLKALANTRARTVLTSGGLQPVLDGGGGKHSVFAISLLEVLRDNDEPLEAQRLYREVAARVLLRASRFHIDQKPEYAALKFAGHESGDFLFVPTR